MLFPKSISDIEETTNKILENKGGQTIIQRASEWVTATSFEDIPEDVRHLGKLQFLDSIAAICAGQGSEAGQKVFAACQRSATEGPCSILPSLLRWTWPDAIYYHAAMINALELDNFSLMGHFSQSAFSVSLAIGELLGASFKDILRAQILAVELSGRMGAYMATGPQQGHMRAFVHRCGGAVAAGCLLGLDARQLSRAIAIALSAPEFPLYPASFSPETKVISTSSPAIEGCRSAFLAAEGFDGTEDILEHPAGFWENFSYMDSVPDLWGNLGNAWSMHAFSYKDQASCAYSQASVVSAVKIRSDSRFDPEAIDHITVETSLLSVVMEAFSMPHHGASITPVNTQFSTRRNVAAALLHGPLNGEFYAAESFRAKKQGIQDLAGHIGLKHDWEMTIRLSRGFDAGLRGGGKPGLLGTGNADKTLKIMKKAFGARKLIGLNDLPPLFFQVKGRNRRYFFKRYWRGFRPKLPFPNAAARAAYRSYEDRLDRIRFHLSARVIVLLKNGSKLVAEQDIPPGFAGDPDKLEVGRKKFFRETLPVLGREKADYLIAQVEGPEDWTVKTLLDGLRPA